MYSSIFFKYLVSPPWRGILARLAVCLASLHHPLAEDQAETRVSLFDSHSHYKAEDAQRFPPSAIVEILEREGIERMLITGTPAHLARQLYQYAPDRFIPFLGLYQGDTNKADWMEDETLPRRLSQQLTEGHYRGIGEIHLFAPERHNPVFRQIIELAQKHRLMLLIHGDWEVIEQAFQWYPGATIIWAHLGTIPQPELIQCMLERYPRGLFIDTSVRDHRFLSGGSLLPEWRNLFVQHADRLLVGIDTFSVQRWERISATTDIIRRWLSQLPGEAARKLAHGNARRLLLRSTTD